MEKNNAKIMYDLDEDILFLSKGKKVKSSIDVGDFVVDISRDNLVTGIEILNASENLKLSQEHLKNLQKATMVVTYKPSSIYVYLVMKLANKEKDVTIPLTINLGHTSIKTENISFAVA